MNRRTFLVGTASTGSALVGGCLTSATPSETTEGGDHDGSEMPDGGDTGDGRENGEQNGDGVEDVSEGDTLDVEKAETYCDPSRSAYPQHTGDLEEYDPADTYEDISVGSRDGVSDSYRPHDVRIWNADDVPAITLRIIDVREDSVPYHGTHEIPDNSELVLSLIEPSNYHVEVSVPATGIERTLSVPCDRFDCNWSSTQIGVYEGGEIRAGIVSTLAGCGFVFGEE